MFLVSTLYFILILSRIVSPLTDIHTTQCESARCCQHFHPPLCKYRVLILPEASSTIPIPLPRRFPLRACQY
ncbi:hypothetical protein DFH29DRAFT_427674 [Suillus ampliporus]|nr:hypothetical protein DFH29DRAFT_427674 [Suillus ampliporus]